MKGGASRETKKAGAVDRYKGEGSGGLRNSSPSMVAAALGLRCSGQGLQSSSTVSSHFSDSANQARVLTPFHGRFSFEENSDVQQTSESLGAKADSENSSFASTPPKKSKVGDSKLRTSQAVKSQCTAETSAAIALSNEADQQLNFEEEMQQMRKTILAQETTFRDQVRELHRVYKVQTLLMAEMKKKDSDVLLHPSGANNRLGPSHSPSDFVALNSGSKRSCWSTLSGHISENTGHEFEPAHEQKPQKTDAMDRLEFDVDLGAKDQMMSPTIAGGPKGTPLMRTFDLERPPEDDDEEQVRKPEANTKVMQDGCIKFLESPVRCPDGQSEVHIGLTAGFEGMKFDQDVQESYGTHVDATNEESRGSKRHRELEEASFFPVLPSKPEVPIREAPLRPTPTMSTQSFLGGLWGYGLSREGEIGFKTEGRGNVGVVKEGRKQESQSLDLKVEEKTVHGAPQVPHWLIQGPTKSFMKVSQSCEDQISNVQQTQSHRQQVTDDPETVKRVSSPHCDAVGGWAGDWHSSGSPLKPWSQAPQRTLEDKVQLGLAGHYRTPVTAGGFSLGSAPHTGSGYGPYKIAQGATEASRDGITFYPSWREGEGTNGGFLQGVYTQSHTLTGSGLPGLGVQLRAYEGHPGLGCQGLVVGPAVNIGPGAAVYQEGPQGIWFQQRNPYSQFQQYQQQQQLASLQSGALSSSPWQAPIQIAQAGAYTQGSLYAIPTGAGPPLGFSVDGLRRVRDDMSGNAWAGGTSGPPFSPFSIVTPPKPPFKRPPKLVLTHDGTTMELKLVPPENESISKVIPDKSLSGSSDGDPSREFEKRDKLDSASAASHSKALREKDEVGSVNRVLSGQLHRVGGKRGREERNSASPKKEKLSLSGGSIWNEKSPPGGQEKGRASVGTVQSVPAVAIPVESSDVEDKGSPGSRSGGSAVDNVINPAYSGLVSVLTCAAVSKLHCREQEVIQMAEPGMQPLIIKVHAKTLNSGHDSGELPNSGKDQGNSKSSEHISASDVSILGKRLSREEGSIDGASETKADYVGQQVEPPHKHPRSLYISSKDCDWRAPLRNGLQEKPSGSNEDEPNSKRKTSDVHSSQASGNDRSVLLECKPAVSSREHANQCVKLQEIETRGKDRDGSEESCGPLASEHGSSSTLPDHACGKASGDCPASGADANEQGLQIIVVCKPDLEIKSSHGKQSPGGHLPVPAGEADDHKKGQLLNLWTQDKFEGHDEVRSAVVQAKDVIREDSHSTDGVSRLTKESNTPNGDSQSSEDTCYKEAGQCSGWWESSTSTEGKDGCSSFASRQGFSDEERERKSSKADLVEAPNHRTSWGDFSRRKRMQRERNTVLAWGQKVTPSRRGGQ